MDLWRENEAKVLNSLRTAAKLLDEAIENVDRQEYEAADLKLWHVAAESEYASFLLSITCSLGDYKPDTAKYGGANSGKQPTLATAQKLLVEALKSVGLNPKESYGILKATISVIREFQDNLSKKR